MFFFKDDIPSCSTCEYATEYIPYFTFPHANPYCCKGHGQCQEDKLCGDYKLINSHFCYECSFWDNGHCSKKNIITHNTKLACAYFILKED